MFEFLMKQQYYAEFLFGKEKLTTQSITNFLLQVILFSQPFLSIIFER